jgi:D-alanyl-D-alanine carboxypeptidase (penicillin-binding protein 5/6)
MLMKKWFILGLAVLLWAGVSDARHAKTRKTRPSPRASQSREATAREAPCRAFIVVEGSTGKVLDGDNIHLKWPPASITKLMVAYIVMERIAKGGIQLSDRVTVSREASKMGGSQVFLKEGETFTVEELMKAMLVASANDAACALAEYVAGSKEAFVKLMNEQARALNMADTQFHSVHGLPPSKGQLEDLTSCHDLAILARGLIRFPKVLEWTSIQSERFRHGTFIMTNHNKLLERMPGVDGLKTGYYRKAGYNVVATAKKGGLRLIVVVMGSSSAKLRDQIAEEKLKEYFQSYEMATIVTKGAVIDKSIAVPNGKITAIKGIASTGFSYPVPSKKRGAIRNELNLPEKVNAEIKEGQHLGEMVIELDHEVIGRVEIVSPVDVPEAGFFSRMMRLIGFGS